MVAAREESKMKLEAKDRITQRGEKGFSVSSLCLYGIRVRYLVYEIIYSHEDDIH